jgi:2-oxoglutarate ferredoxin oxidoreductase subunit alpha
MEKSEILLMKGNCAMAEGAVIAGCRFYFGYPITPQNEVPEYMSERMPEVGGVFIQAESELASINMVFGASAAGARVMTSTSSPGFSLMQEGMSYLAGARLPCVVANVQRCGPGLGNVWTGQCDYLQAVKGGGNGDYHLIVLAPASPQEMMDLTILAFGLADKYRVPALILSDAVIGQMMEKVVMREDFSKKYEKPWALTGAKNRAKNVVRSLFGSEDAIEKNNTILQDTYSLIKKNEVRFESFDTDDAELVVVAYGMSARIARSAVHRLREEGRRVGFFRPISLYPFPYQEIKKLASGSVRNFMSVEMSAGQMVEDLVLAAGGKADVSFYGRTGGNIVEESEICKRALDTLNGKGGQYLWQL